MILISHNFDDDTVTRGSAEMRLYLFTRLVLSACTGHQAWNLQRKSWRRAIRSGQGLIELTDKYLLECFRLVICKPFKVVGILRCLSLRHVRFRPVGLVPLVKQTDCVDARLFISMQLMPVFVPQVWRRRRRSRFAAIAGGVFVRVAWV